MITNEKLDRLVAKCKTSQDLKKLLIALINETIGVPTDKQLLKIIKIKNEKEEETGRR